MIRKFIHKMNTSIRQLSIDTQIPYSTLNEMVNKKSDFKKCSIENFRKLAQHFHISVEGLYELFQLDYDIEQALMERKDGWFVLKCNILGEEKTVKLLPDDEVGKLFVDEVQIWEKEELFESKEMEIWARNII